jgi:hypothetical protein
VTEHFNELKIHEGTHFLSIAYQDFLRDFNFILASKRELEIQFREDWGQISSTCRVTPLYSLYRYRYCEMLDSL